MPRRLFVTAFLASAAVLAFGFVSGWAESARPATPAASITPPPLPTSAGVTNPPVEPGKVTWHRSFADARAASARSGKPVLLFHMMGQLDRQFC